MSIDEQASLLSLAHEAMDLASKHLQGHRPTKVIPKQDRDMVTDLDVEIENMVQAFLRERHPEIGFLGEENGRVGDTGTYWVLDPIDGTANFIHGLPLCGIILCLIQDGKTVLGLVDLPFLDQRYHAIAGGGAYVNGAQIKVSGTTDLSEAMVSVSGYGTGPQRGKRNKITFALEEQLADKAQKVRSLGSVAIDLAWVAEGKLDANLTLGNKPWDTAAGVLIAREAGAVVLDSDGGEHNLDSRCGLATTPGLKDALVPVFEAARGTSYWPDH
jgi:myo-inositol-1(or 4)-monophosphatase